MTNADLDRLDALAKKATPGPWRTWGMQVRYSTCPEKCADFDHSEMLAETTGGAALAVTGHLRTFDTDLIAALSPDTVSALVAVARLGMAWEEAEGALPEGWELHVWASPTGSRWRHAAAVPPMGRYERKIAAGGLDMEPAAALLALAEALRSRP